MKISNKRWLAPEVLTTKLLTPETDVFAFAYLMYEVLTMQVPHGKIKNEDVLEYIRKNPNVRPSKLLHEILRFPDHLISVPLILYNSRKRKQERAHQVESKPATISR